MLPAAVLAVIVEAQGVQETRAQLASVNSELAKVESMTGRVGKGMQTMGRRTETVGKAMTKYIAAPLAAIGVAAGVMSAKFHRSMNLIATDAGGSTKEVHALGNEVLALGEHSEFGPQKLADALFYIESAGIRGHKAIKTLNEIQRAAMAGNAGLEQAVFGTVGAYNALGKEGENVEQILATMNSVVGHGHLRLDELTAAMSTGLIGSAKTFGINFQGLGSALAFFTRMSEPAQQAATRMRQTITHLASSSTNKAKEALESIGMNVDQMSEKIFNTHKLGPVIQELAQHLEGLSEAKKNQVLTDAFGGGRYGTQIREAISNVGLLLKTEEEVASKATIARLHHSERLQEESDAVKLKKLWSDIEVQLIKLGDSILPIVVPIFTSVVHAIAGVSMWFGHLSKGTQAWIVKLGLLLIAISLIVRVVGGFIKSLGEIIAWFGKTEVANAELVASNEAVAASYAEMTVAAEAALAARKEMEFASGPFAGGIQADKVGLPIASDLAPSLKNNMGTAMKSMVSGIPGMFAAYGLGNVLTSAMSGDMQDAGFESGGAMIGGLAAVLTGNPELAGVGIGIGSFVGELASKAFSDAFGGGMSTAEELKQSRQERMQGVTQNMHQTAKQAHVATKNLAQSSKTVRRAQQQDKKVTSEVQRSTSHLSQARERYGDTSSQAAKAERELTRAKQRSLTADRGLEAAEKVHGELRTASIRADRAEVQAAKELIATKKEDMRDAFEHLSVVQKQPPTDARLEKEHKWLKRIKQDHEDVTKAKSEETETIKTATTQIGPKFARQLENLSPTLNALKESSRAAGESVKEHLGTLQHGFHNLTPGIQTLGEVGTEFRHTQTGAKNLGKTLDGPFKTQASDAFRTAGKNAEKFHEQASGAMSESQLEATTFIEAWGGTAPAGAKEAHTHGKAVKKARGGHLPGARSGDRIPALLEDGEYIVNKRAVQRVGVHALNKLNFEDAPRYAEGGAVQKAYAEAKMLANEHVPYVWGGGHSSFSANGGLDCSGAVSLVLHAAGLLGGAPMTSGPLMNWGLPGPGPITVYANPDHAWMSIQGHPWGTSVNDSSHGLGFYGQPSADYKSSFAVRHANVKAAELMGGGAHQMKERSLKGSGNLAKLGNAQIHGVTAQMQKYLDKHAPGEWGGGNIGEQGGGIAQIAAEAVKKTKAPYRAGLSLFEALFAESSMGASAPGNVLQALPPYTKIRPAADEIMGFLTGHPEWTGVTAIGQARANPSEKAYEIAQDVQKSGAGEASHGASNYGAQRAAALASMKANGLSKGGSTEKKAGKGAAHSKPVKELAKVQGALKKAMHLVKKGHTAKGYGDIRKANRALGKVEGLSPHMVKSLVEGSEGVTTFSEFATNAGEGNMVEEEPPNAPDDFFAKTIFGNFKGHDEGYWYVSELESMTALRNNLLNARKNIKGPQKMINEMVKRFKKALHAAEKRVRELKRKEKELEKDKEEIEAAEKLGAHKLEKEKNEWEHTLNKLQGAKHPDKTAIANAHSQIKTINNALHDTQKKGADGTKSDQEKIAQVKKELNKREKEVGGYQKFVPELEAKRETINETAQGIIQGRSVETGPMKGKSWEGLEELQGRVKDYKKGILSKMPDDVHGGNIRSVQEALKTYGEVNKVPTSGGSSDTTVADEMKELKKEIDLEWRKKYIVSQSELSVLRGMPSVTAMARVPYAGSFALGGSMVATVGERGPEAIVAPEGSRIISHPEAMNAISGKTGTQINFEEVHFHEDDDTVTGRANGETFEQKVKGITRKQGSGRQTPGGMHGRRKN